jgi:hypothetical protein
VRKFLKDYIYKGLHKKKNKLISYKGIAIKKISNLKKGGKKVGLTTADKWFNKYVNKLAYCIFNVNDEIIFNGTEMNKIKKRIINA